MPRTIKCPSCKNEVKVPEVATLATCPKCCTTFRADAVGEEEGISTAPSPAPIGKSAPAGIKPAPARAPAPVAADDEDEEGSWISPWGAAAFVAVTLALIQASVPGVRALTLALAVLGLFLVGLGIWATRGDRQRKDWVWFSLTGALSMGVLLAALAFRGRLLNERWAQDTEIPPENPEMLRAVARSMPRALEEGKPMGAEDWADAEAEAVRQGDVLVRVESVKVGPISGKGDTPYLQVVLRVTNCKPERTFTVEGFSKDQPTLTDDAGHLCAFVEQRPRRQSRGNEPVFDPTHSGVAELAPLDRPSQDYLLVFASPPATFQSLKLEVPAAPWGRSGVCRLRINRLFDLLTQ